MEDGILSPGTMLGASASSAMEFDYMDELLLEGCWVETTDGSEFLYSSPSNPAVFLDPSFVWPNPETINGDLSSSPSQKSNQEDKQISSLPGNSSLNELQAGSPVKTQSLGRNVVGLTGCGNDAGEISEASRRWWIGPRADSGLGTSVRERLIKALKYIKDFTKDKDVLTQIWVPVNRDGKRVLTTDGQPFTLDPSCQRLANYRDISINYQFSAEEDSKELAGLPGRVFLGKIPEWTPDVRFFRSDEYLRVDHAQRYDVRGTLALPVFEQGSRTCLGVIEVVTTTQNIKYCREIESVCRALEAVDLRSSEVLSVQTVKDFLSSSIDMLYQAALPEIQEVLRSACDTHRLPLAQIWVPCIQQGKGGCRHSDDNFFCCVSTVDHACHVADPCVRGFHEACSEHHLLKGQGVAGGAFLTNQPCFSSDITSFGKTEYPLSHHARIFGLCAAVAIRLRSVHTDAADFVLEFFLPMDCRNLEEQKKMLTLLSIIIQQVCYNLRVVTDKELEEETNLPVGKVLVPPDGRPGREEMMRVKNSDAERYARDNLSRAACPTEVQNEIVVPLCQKEKHKVMQGKKSMECRQNQEDCSRKGAIECGGDSTFAEGSFSSVHMAKTGVRSRTKAQKTITLQVLRQYFAGSLKDAAKIIGVCPTTLKRICRQHGITRWPSRKIKKVGHSLKKLQHVIDSVEVASSAFQEGSFCTNFPDLASPNLLKSSPFSASMLSDHPKPSSIPPEGGMFISQSAAPKSPSSCTQSSSSSHCCSSGTEKHPSVLTVPDGKDPMLGENLGNGALKRFRSDAELHASGQEQKPLPRSQSHKLLAEQANLGNLLPLPENGSRVTLEFDSQRVKVTYGNEKIRLRMPNNWRYKDLLQEIARRFNIDDITRFDLKYLDDDLDWVLLTCEEDLEECIDVCHSSQSHTIKLSLQASPYILGKSLGGSVCP